MEEPLDELLEWLRSQHKGLRTYKSFQQKVLEAGGKKRGEYALYYLLSSLVGRFVDTYDDRPLMLDVTDEAFRRLVELVERAGKFEKLSAKDQVGFLNELASTELAPSEHV
jgi:hypothetical protein